MNTTVKSVLIMMASYNGERFISKQIQSIIDQDYKNWHLIIQDDGSTDSTIKIINQFCNKDNRIQLCINNSSYHGPFVNFHLLANKCKKMQSYDYYMFSDQDDLWDSCKISQLMTFIDKYNQEIPILAYSDMRIIDANDQVTCDSMDSIYKNGNLNKYAVFFAHKIFGCSLIMNSSCFFSAPILDVSNPDVAELSHDNFYAKIAAALGNIYYYSETLMGYRRYGDNVSSGQIYQSNFIRLIKRILNLNAVAKDQGFVYIKSLYTIRLLQQKELTKSQKNMIDSIQKVIQNGGIQTFSFFKKHCINLGKKTENISHIVILLFKLQKKFIDK